MMCVRSSPAERIVLLLVRNVLVSREPTYAIPECQLLSLGEQDGGFMAEELNRLNGELKSLERSTRQLEFQPDEMEPVELACVTDALQRIDSVWEVLHPEEQRRVLELLIEAITVSKENVEVRFRSNGIERVVEELEPIGVGSDG